MTYKADAIQISKGIKKNRISMDSQVRYYEYLLENIDSEIGSIDNRIEKLRQERERLLCQVKEAPQKIVEIKNRLGGLYKKHSKLMIAPKIRMIKLLKAELIKLGVEV